MNTDKIYAESIAKEYAPKDKSKIIALRKLDAKAKLPATIFTYTLGIISALVFGTGTSSPPRRESSARRPMTSPSPELSINAIPDKSRHSVAGR